MLLFFFHFKSKVKVCCLSLCICLFLDRKLNVNVRLERIFFPSCTLTDAFRKKNARNCSANGWKKNPNRFEIHMQCDFSLKWCPISRAYFICVFIGKLPIILYGEFCIGTGLIWINGVNRKNKWRWKLVLSMNAEQQMSFVAWLTVLSDTFDLNPLGSWKCIAIHAIDMLPNCLCLGDATVHTFYFAHAKICRNWKVRTILYINVTFMLRARTAKCLCPHQSKQRETGKLSKCWREVLEFIMTLWLSFNLYHEREREKKATANTFGLLLDSKSFE